MAEEIAFVLDVERCEIIPGFKEITEIKGHREMVNQY